MLSSFITFPDSNLPVSFAAAQRRRTIPVSFGQDQVIIRNRAPQFGQSTEDDLLVAKPMLSRMAVHGDSLRRLVPDSLSGFYGDRVLEDATLFHLSQLGSWAQNLPSSLLEDHAELRQLGRFRNQIVHASGTVTAGIIWNNARQIAEFLQNFQPGESCEQHDLNLHFLPRHHAAPSCQELQARIMEGLARVDEYRQQQDSGNEQLLYDAIAYNLITVGESAVQLLDSASVKLPKPIRENLQALAEIRNDIAHPEQSNRQEIPEWQWDTIFEIVEEVSAALCEEYPYAAKEAQQAIATR